MIKNQQQMQLSSYTFLYDIVVPKDNMLRKIASSSGLLDMELQGQLQSLQ